MLGLADGEEGDFLGGIAFDLGFAEEFLDEWAHQPQERAGGQAHGIKHPNQNRVQPGAV